MLQIRELLWQRDPCYVGWTKANRGMKSMGKRAVMNTLHGVCGNGEPAKAAAILYAVLMDPKLQASMQVVSSDESLPVSTRVEADRLIEFRERQYEKKMMAAAAGANAGAVLKFIRENEPIRESTEGRIIRRAISAALLPSVVMNNLDLARWRRFLHYSDKVNLCELQTVRLSFLEGKGSLTDTSKGGNSKWEAHPEHARWKEEMLAWMEKDGVTRVVPGKNTICYQHLDASGSHVISHHSKCNRTNLRGRCYEHCRRHVLHFKTATDVALHARFLKEHPHVDPQRFVRQRFTELMPFWVKPKPREVCVCTYCSNAKGLLDGLRKAVHSVHGGDNPCLCACSLCNDGGCKKVYDNVYNLINAWTCHGAIPWNDVYEGYDEDHVKGLLDGMRCRLGRCKDCKHPSSAPFYKCPEEKKIDQRMVTWKEVVKESNMVQTQNGLKEQKNVHIKTQRGSVIDLKRKVLRCFAGDRIDAKRVLWTGWTQDEPHFVHLLVKDWQSKCLDTMIDTCSCDTMIIIIDYAMNYAHKHDQEFSEEHFSPWSSTILPIVCYYRGLDGVVGAETFAVLTDDLRHDHQAVQAHLKQCIQFHRVRFAERGYVLKSCIVWSDGCAAQFKTKSIFGSLPVIYTQLRERGPHHYDELPIVTAFDEQEPIYYQSKAAWRDAVAGSPILQLDSYQGVRISWNFFQSCHGKGPSDSENAVIKGHLSKAEANGKCMPYTADLVREIIKYLTEPSRTRRKKKRCRCL